MRDHTRPPQAVVVLEYDPEQARVMVRGVFPEDIPPPRPLESANLQNLVTVFVGVDMGRHVGFIGLVPGPAFTDGWRLNPVPPGPEPFGAGAPLINLSGMWHVRGNMLYLGGLKRDAGPQVPSVRLPDGMDAYRVAEAHNAALITRQLEPQPHQPAGGLEAMTVGELLNLYPNGFSIGPRPDPALMRTLYSSSRLPNVGREFPFPPEGGGYLVVDPVEIPKQPAAPAPPDPYPSLPVPGVWMISDQTYLCGLCGEAIRPSTTFFKHGVVQAWEAGTPYHRHCAIDRWPPSRYGSDDRPPPPQPAPSLPSLTAEGSWTTDEKIQVCYNCEGEIPAGENFFEHRQEGEGGFLGEEIVLRPYCRNCAVESFGR